MNAVLDVRRGTARASDIGEELEPTPAVQYTFDIATLVRSNLGGMGGRCTTEGLCVEPQTASTPHEIYYQTVGVTRSGEPIDMRITNQSEYRGWNIRLNGIKKNSQGSQSGYFGVVNLLGPRSTDQSGAPKRVNNIAGI